VGVTEMWCEDTPINNLQLDKCIILTVNVPLQSTLTFKSEFGVIQGYWKWRNSIPFLLMFFSRPNYRVCLSCTVVGIFDFEKTLQPWNPGLGSLKADETGIDRTYV